MKRERKSIGGPEKLAILRRYLVEKVPISDLCDEYGLQPSQLYYWQAQLFEHGASIFERKPGRQASAETAKDRKIEQLEAVVAQKNLKLAQKNEVISELMEENVREKKATGEL
jgi:transposase-like protein